VPTRLKSMGLNLNIMIKQGTHMLSFFLPGETYLSFSKVLYIMYFVLFRSIGA